MGSLEPKLIDEEFVKKLKELKKVCPHFHLSLQSGCTEVLKRMNRRYTVDEFKKAVYILRNNFKEVMLTADVIVGFPGETDKEFEQTYNFLKEIKFYKIHVFKYSKRENTKAADFPDQVAPEIKEERSKKIIQLSQKIQNQYNKSYIGKEVEVLVEEKQGQYFKGHTRNYICVEIKNAKENIENKIVNTEVIEVLNENLLRRIV